MSAQVWEGTGVIEWVLAHQGLDKQDPEPKFFFSLDNYLQEERTENLFKAVPTVTLYFNSKVTFYSLPGKNSVFEKGRNSAS